MKTYIFEAVQSQTDPQNYGKFLVGLFENEWKVPSYVSEYKISLLVQCGWRAQHIFIIDMETGEGAMFQPGGLPHADLNKHRIWVCPLFEPFLTWVYALLSQHPRRTWSALLSAAPQIIELPDAPFSLQGYRRPGPTVDVQSSMHDKG